MYFSTESHYVKNCTKPKTSTFFVIGQVKPARGVQFKSGQLRTT